VKTDCHRLLKFQANGDYYYVINLLMSTL
jgi:hypothetical protein